MTALINHQVRLNAHPVGMPGPETWRFTTEPIAAPAEGEFLSKVLCISMDPAMRVWLNAGDSYVRHVGLGEVMRASVVATVIASKHPGFSPGDCVAGRLGVQQYAISNGVDMIGQTMVKIPKGTIAPSAYLGVLGVPGLTAYFGLLEVGRPEAGQTVVVSGATGAVGSVVGQIARIKGCRVVGIAGGPDKCAYLKDSLGFDGAVDYQAGNVSEQLARLCPDGIDIYFDNVGGEILDAALTQLALRARVVLCGAMSQYTATGPIVGPKNYRALLIKRARMEGFVLYDFAARYEEARRELASWIADGSLIAREEVMEGLDSFPDAMRRMLSGGKTGKLLIRLADA